MVSDRFRVIPVSRHPTPNLRRMRQFFDAYRSEPELSTLVRELPWTHNLIILTQSKRPEERAFYLRMAIRVPGIESPNLDMPWPNAAAPIRPEIRPPESPVGFQLIVFKSIIPSTEPAIQSRLRGVR